MPENDAFIWAAQIVNFLILVVLLRKFLYRPVLDAIESRQREISQRVAEADEVRQEAEQLAADYREREQELAAARETIQAEARKEVEAWKEQALDEARGEVDAAQAHWWEAILRDRQRLLKELRERAGRQVHHVARRVLGELANAELEQQMVDVFSARLKSLDVKTRQRLTAGNAHAAPCTLTSALPLSEDGQKSLKKQLQAEFGEIGQIRFEIDPDLICGVELQMGDQRLSWNVADVIDSLERNFSAALDHGHLGSPKEGAAS